MADRPEMFGPTREFSGMADSMEPCKMLWADPCCRGNEIWARRGDPVAYRLALFVVNSHDGTFDEIIWRRRHCGGG